MAFDPCREWLGIDAVYLSDPRKVLGLPPGRLPAELVHAAAAERLAALAGVRPGAFAKAHSALVARVLEARDKLLEDAMPEARPPAAQFPPPLPPADPVMPFGPATGGADPAAPSMASDGEAELEPPIPWSPRSGAVPRARVRRRGRSPEGNGLLLSAIALLAAAVAGLAFLVSQGGWPGRREVAVESPRSGKGTVPAVSETPPAVPPTAGQRQPAGTGSTAGESTPPPDSGGDEAQRRKSEAKARREREARQAAEEARRQEQQQAEEQQRLEERRLAEERMKSEEQQRAEREMRSRISEAVEKGIRDAYKAIQRGEFDTARRAIAAAGSQIGDDVEAATRLERWNLFTSYAREFPRFRDQAFAAANAGRDYEVNGKKFTVIEITPESFVYRLAGENVRVPPDAVDPAITMAIVAAWFAADGRAANHLFLGAHWLSLDPPDTRRARAEWRIAGNGGENVEPLMALLDDPVIRQAGR